jgi:hypothetical protein
LIQRMWITVSAGGAAFAFGAALVAGIGLNPPVLGAR